MLRESQKKKLFMVLIISALVLTAYMCRIFRGIIPFRIGFLRAAIYIVLFSAWGISVHRRMIQPQLNRSMMVIAGFMIFWMLVRTIKYEFSGIIPVSAERYLWYLYYAPMLFIPPLGLYAVHFLGKAENYKAPGRMCLPFLMSALLLLLVLTNDIHQLVFSFPKGVSFFQNGEYTHEACFYMILIWVVLCCGDVLWTLFKNSRLPGVRKRIIFPLIPFAVMVLYTPLYLKGGARFHALAGDLIIVFCILTIAIFEACFQCRLLPTNSEYNKLFHISSIRALITDQNYEEIIRAGNYVEIEKSAMQQAEEAPVILSPNLRLHSAPVGSGHILWQEDISTLTETLSELEDLNQYLQGQAETIQKDYSMARQERRLSEKTRLHHRILARTKSEIEYYLALAEELEGETDADRAADIVYRIAFVSAYIKRQNNLIFLDEENGQIPAQELGYCVNESFQSLQLRGISCSLELDSKITMSFMEMAWLYETFYYLVKDILNDLCSVRVSLALSDGETVMSMILAANVPLQKLCERNVTVTEQEDGYHILFSFPKGGVTL